MLTYVTQVTLHEALPVSPLVICEWSNKGPAGDYPDNWRQSRSMGLPALSTPFNLLQTICHQGYRDYAALWRYKDTGNNSKERTGNTVGGEQHIAAIRLNNEAWTVWIANNEDVIIAL